MSRMIVLLSVVIALFALAAGGSWYLQYQQNKDADPTHTAEETPKKKPGGATLGSKPAATEDLAQTRPIIRPSATPPEPERLTQLAAALQQQQEAIKTREQQIVVREKQMDIQHEILQKEKKELDIVRKKMDIEMQALEAKIAELEKQSIDGVKERKIVDAQRKELERTQLEIDTQEWKNLKEQVKKLESMDAESAAIVVVQMVDQGKLDTVVKMLSHMRDRQAAGIFAEIAKQDSKLPGQLFERMIALKTPVVTAPK